ncbi:MAG TPA: phage tail length tape measure family protein, partial [Devosia sp.]|nr:phage tail length tape measure family protein [Devosia sp.]
RFNTSNIAAQFQDVGVTAAMGMSPIMIALQQGTQLSAALGNQGLRGTVMALGGAFASVISPVSLLTIGLVALGAVGIQALMSIMGGTEDASSALEDHKKWLDQVLIGYEAAGKAANETLERAQKLPAGVVRSDLLAGLKEQETAATALQQRIESVRSGLTDTIGFMHQLAAAGAATGVATTAMDAAASQVEFLRDLDLSTSSTTSQLESAMVAARNLYNTVDDPAIKDMADAVYGLALQLMGLRGETASTISALAALNNQAMQIDLSAATDKAAAAIERLRNLAPDLRTAYQKAGDELNAALASAPDQIIRQAAQSQYAKTVAALDEQKRQQDALRAGKAGNKTLDQWGTATDNFQQRIASARMEIAALGQSTLAVERNKAAFDLLNQAKAAGIPIDEKVTSTINRLAGEYASTQVALEAATAAQQRHNDMMSMGEGAFVSMAVSMGQLARSSGDFWEGMRVKAMDTLASITDEMVRMAATDVFKSFTGQGGGGGGLGGLIASIFGFGGGGGYSYGAGVSGDPWAGMRMNANGNVYQSPNLSAYSNTIVNRPTMFAFASGAGLMGEAGEEAIMPLRRNRSGQLGVHVANENAARAPTGGVRVEIHNYSGAPVKQEQSKGADGIDVTRIFIGTMKSGFADGSMDTVMAQTYGLKRVGR